MTTVGIAQWHAECGDPDRNLRDALAAVHSLAERGCDLVVLPELWPCGYDPATLAADAAAAAEPLDGPRGTALAEAAAALGIWLFAGTVPEQDGDRLHNTAVVYSPDGTLRAAHRKVHLYTPLGEDTVFAPGTEATVLDVDGLGIVGLATCFDGDHPAYARRLLERGAHVVVAPCAYETAASTWWDLLYPANALTNGQWWLMANQSGGDLMGGSRVIAPDGTVRSALPRAGDGLELLVLAIDAAAEIAEAERAAGVLWQDAGRAAVSG